MPSGARLAGRPILVIALGASALSRRSEPLTTESTRTNIREAVQAIAPLARDYRLLIAHGTDPHVGRVASEPEPSEDAEHPLDILAAATQGLIGYTIEQELVSVLPASTPVATLLTMIEVDLRDAAFANPTKLVGPLFSQGDARRLSAERRWDMARDGDGWRRVVPSPKPLRILELKAIRWLVERNAIVICAGGAALPVTFEGAGRRQRGLEAVIDNDLAAELLAESIDASVFVMATDVDAVYAGWGTPEQKRLGWLTPDELAKESFAAGSMGPKVDAARRFVTATGRRAVIGSPMAIQQMVRGEAGTNIVPQSVDSSPTLLTRR